MARSIVALRDRGLLCSVVVLALLAVACDGHPSGPTSLQQTTSPKVPSSVTVTAQQTALSIGQSTQLTATLTYKDGSTADITATAGWYTTEPFCATVTNGLVKGLRPGKVTITARYPGIAPGQLALTVSSAQITPTAPTPTTLIGTTWDVTLHLTELKGGDGGCAVQQLQAQMSVPKAYAVSVTDKRGVTIASASGEFACAFSEASIDGSGFTTEGVNGVFTCTAFPRTITCGDGTVQKVMTIAQDITGRVSGSQISGEWDVDLVAGAGLVIMKSQFAGSRR